MTQYKPTLFLVARIMLAVMFLLAGFGKLGNMDGFAGYMASGGIPAALAWPVVAFEIIVPLALLVGYQTRLAALALGGFTLMAAIMFHFVPADQLQMTMFLKNVAIAGGLLLLVAEGPGALSLDARKAKSAVAA